MSKINEGLRELAGFSLCERPGCHRLLKTGQGVTHPNGQRTCFTPTCQDWVRVQLS